MDDITPTQVFMALNTALLSVILTLATIMYRDMMKRINRMDRQIIACLVALIGIVNHVEHLPAHLLEKLTDALNENGGTRS